MTQGNTNGRARGVQAQSQPGQFQANLEHGGAAGRGRGHPAVASGMEAGNVPDPTPAKVRLTHTTATPQPVVLVCVDLGPHRRQMRHETLSFPAFMQVRG
jgi:hypothetical protein